MKKTAIILLAFLICVCCIGLVACRERQTIPVKPSGSQSIIENSGYQGSAGQNADQSSSQRRPVEPITDGGGFDGGNYD